MSIIREFTLYLHAGITTPEVIHANQYSQGETWIFKLLQDDGSVYVPSTGALIGVKADGHAIAGLTGTVLGDGRVSITTTQQLTAAAGDATCELTIDGGTNGSANFVIRVEKKPTDDAILSESDLSIIQEGLNSVTPAAIEEKVSDWLEENFTEPPVDQSLTIANAAADAKVTGDKITELKTALKDITGNESIPITTAGLYRLNNTTAPTDPETNATYTCTKVQCSENDSFLIDGGSYGNAARLYAFADSSLNILRVAPSAYIAINELIKAPANTAWLYVNSYNYGGNAVKLIRNEPLIDTVDNLINDFSEITETSPNMLDESTIATGYIGTNGNISTNSQYRYYEQYIDVRELTGETLYFNNTMRFVTAYNASKSVIASSGAENVSSYTVPSGVSFIRVSIFYTYAEMGVMVNTGDASLPYQPYGDFVKWSKVTETQGFNRLEGILGKPSESATADSLNSGGTLEITNCNISVKKSTGISAFCKFDSFGGVIVGKGYETNGGTYVEITDTEVIVHIYFNEDRTTVFEHGLTITEFLNVNMYETMNTVNVEIMTLNGSYSCSSTNDGDCRGVPFIKTVNALTNVKLTCSFADLTKPLWLFGDSYLGKNSNRVMYYMMQMGYTDYAVIGYPGMSAPTAFTELLKALKFGCPNYIVWMLGMNGSYNDSVSALNSLIDICGRYNIKPVLYLVPSVPQYLHEQLNEYIKTLGFPYIDGYGAVGSDSSGNWYNGYLSTDNVHPTEKGARAIAMRMLVDCSEFMLYGKDNITQ